jgi:hypothetical protein
MEDAKTWWTAEELRIFELMKHRQYEEVSEACRQLGADGNGTWKWLATGCEAALKSGGERNYD